MTAALYQHILVPFDASVPSEKALCEAIRLAQATGAQLTLLHVVDELSYVTGFEPAMNYVNEIIPLMREAGEKILAHGSQLARDAGVEVDKILITESIGRISDQVSAEAARRNIDLIVVGSHGRRGVGRLLLGSDAEQIVRHATVPVMGIRAPESTTELPIF
jgi:nucleotide-binding universal stress UspA family protein